MAKPQRQQILEAVRDRLLAITTDHGFNTNAGAAVFLGERPELGESDPQIAIAVLIGADEVRHQSEQLLLNLPIMIEALAKVTLDEPFLAAEQVLGDIKTAIELADRTLGGLVKRQIVRGRTVTYVREAGSQYAAVGITYTALYTELWGTP